MTRPRYRASLLLPLILIAGGVLLLLDNLGIVGFDAWDTVLRLWPVLLIVVGLDLVFGRSSLGRAVSALVVVCVLLAVGFAAFHLFAPDRWVAKEQAVAFPLAGANAARISLSCAGCAIRVDGFASSDALIDGHVSVRRDESLSQSSTLTGETTSYELTSHTAIWLPFATARGRGTAWRLSLSPTIPIELTVFTEGSADLDLQELQITALDATCGEGACTIVLARLSSALYSLFGDDLTLIVPDGVGVRIDRSAAVTIDAPSDYVKTEYEVLSPTFGTAHTNATIVIRAGAGTVSIVPLADRKLDVPLDD